MGKNNMSEITAKRNIIISMLIFGSIGVFKRQLAFDSGFIALSRAMLGLLFLLLLCIFKKTPPNIKAVKKNAVKLCVSGFLLGMNWVALFEAFNHTTVAAATICYYMAPVLVSIASAFMGEKLSAKKWLLTAVAFFGMLAVSGVVQTGFTGAKGLGLSLLAAAMYAAIVLINKSLVDISGTDRTMVQLFVSALTLLPYVVVKGGFPAEGMGGFAPVVLLAVLGIVHTGLAYTLYFGAMAYVPAVTAAQLSYIDPVFAVVLSVVLLKEPMEIYAVIGCITVIAALVLGERAK